MLEQWHYGCLFCRSTAETTTAGRISRMHPDVETAVPSRIRRKHVNGVKIEDRVPLLPGYIFFRAQDIASPVQLSRISNVWRLLEYDNHTWELNGRDRDFAEVLFDNEELQTPNATFVDGRLHFVDGFLYGHDDAVTRVNRRKQTAEIQLEVNRLTFWIGYIEIDGNETGAL